MAADRDHGPNRYNSTPRKVFDKHVDRMEAKRQRDREDHRADMQALIKRLVNLEEQLQLLHQHVQTHCERIEIGEEISHRDGTEDTRDS